VAARVWAALRIFTLRFVPLLRAACLIVPLSGCGLIHLWDPTHQRRGELIDPDALKQLIPGTSTRADAISLLGNPTAHATFDDNSWIYITQITSTRIGRTPGVTMQKVLVLKFDQGGTLRGMTQLDKADGKQIAMAHGATPSPGSEASFMQQLLGNVGKFTPAGLPGGGVGGPTGGGNANALP
jgi:outer membrane protein assembly factor BamE (lipoprotein component of BamABCDE complex)